MDVAVVGDGFAGLSTAYHLLDRGLTPDVYGRPVRIGQASQVAAGMLGVAAARDLAGINELLTASRKYWPEFAGAVGGESGIELNLGTGGTLFLAADEDEFQDLQAISRRTGRLGLAAEWFDPEEVDELHPLVAEGIEAALHVDLESWVNPRVVYPALTQALEQRGVDIISREVELIGPLGDGGARLALEGNERADYDRVVLAAGCWSSYLLPKEVAPEFDTEAVRGQYLLIESPGHVGWPAVRRAGKLCYLVPAVDGDFLYLGATAEPGEWEPPDNFEPAFRVLESMTGLLPGLEELEIRERGFGLRPAVADRHPVLGFIPGTDIFVHTGHFASGVLLSPYCGKLAAAAIAGEEPELDFTPLGPGRLLHDSGASAGGQ